MTRAHFNALAQALANVRPNCTESEMEHLQWKCDVRAIADTCANFNQQFDYQRFLTACETWEAK